MSIEKSVEDDGEWIEDDNPFAVRGSERDHKIQSVKRSIDDDEEMESINQAVNLISTFLQKEVFREDADSAFTEFSHLGENVAEFLDMYGFDHNKILEHSLRQIGKVSDKTIEICYSLGLNLFESNELLDAQKVFHFLRVIAPEIQNLWVAEMVCFRKQGEHMKALEVMELASKTFKKSPSILLHLADCYLHNGDFMKARQAFFEVKPIIDGNHERWNHLNQLIKYLSTQLIKEN